MRGRHIECVSGTRVGTRVPRRRAVCHLPKLCAGLTYIDDVIRRPRATPPGSYRDREPPRATPRADLGAGPPRRLTHTGGNLVRHHVHGGRHVHRRRPQRRPRHLRRRRARRQSRRAEGARWSWRWDQPGAAVRRGWASCFVRAVRRFAQGRKTPLNDLAVVAEITLRTFRGRRARSVVSAHGARCAGTTEGARSGSGSTPRARWTTLCPSPLPAAPDARRPHPTHAVSTRRTASAPATRRQHPTHGVRTRHIERAPSTLLELMCRISRPCATSPIRVPATHRVGVLRTFRGPPRGSGSVARACRTPPL